MERFHKVASVVWSAVFLVMLQELSVPRPIFRYLVAGFLLFAFLLTLYNRKYLKHFERSGGWILIRPVLLFASAFALFEIIPSGFLRSLFLLSVFVIGAGLEYFIGKFAEGILINETLIIAFGMFMAICGMAFQYFPTFQTWYLIMVFAGTFLVARSFYEFTPQTAMRKLADSVVIALFCAEFFWSLSFLPIHFSASALILFNFFYFCLILQYYNIYNLLSLHKLQLHLAIFFFGSSFIFFLTPWKIITN